MAIVMLASYGYSQEMQGINFEPQASLSEAEQRGIERLMALEEANRALEQRLADIEKISSGAALSTLEANYRLTTNSLELLETLLSATKKVVSQREAEKKNAFVSSINNPTKDDLGFRFTDIIAVELNNTIDWYIANSGDDVKDLMSKNRDRLKETVLMVTGSLGKVFPPLQVVSGVVTTLSNFVVLKNEPAREVKGKTTTAVANAVTPIKADFVEAFMGRIGPYINYYQALAQINDDYTSSLNKHGVEYRYVLNDLEKLKAEVLATAGIDISGDYRTQIDQLYSRGSAAALTNAQVVSINNNPRVQALAKISKVISMQVSEFYDMYKSYNGVVLTNYSNTISALNAALSLPQKSEQKILRSIKELEALRDGDRSNNTIGFVHSFDDELNKINRLISSI